MNEDRNKLIIETAEGNPHLSVQQVADRVGVTKALVSGVLFRANRNKVFDRAKWIAARGVNGVEAPKPGRPKKNAPRPKVVPMKTNAPVSMRQTCCWPMWADGEDVPKTKRFCEKPALIGKRYCPEHAAIAFVPPREKISIPR